MKTGLDPRGWLRSKFKHLSGRIRAEVGKMFRSQTRNVSQHEIAALLNARDWVRREMRHLSRETRTKIEILFHQQVRNTPGRDFHEIAEEIITKEVYIPLGD